MTTRRDFLKNSAMLTAAAMAGVAGAPKFTFAQQAGGKTFIKVFMRGGADGLHLFPAVGDMAYLGNELRPRLRIEPGEGADEAHPLQGTTYRAINPNLTLLREIWQDGRMMISPATFFEGGGQSHFDNQRWIGNGARSNLIEGYLNRYLQQTSNSAHPIRGAVTGKTSISQELSGPVTVPAIRDTAGFNLTNSDFCEGTGCADNQLTEYMSKIGSHNIDLSAMEGQTREAQLIMIESIEDVQRAGLNYVEDAGGMTYSRSGLGQGLKLVAQLLKAGVPLEVAALDWNIGWDTHSDQIADGANPFSDPNKGYHSKMQEGARDFVTFYRDMSGTIDNVIVLVCTEFGRTIRENGTSGTDHGNAGAWFAFGGPTTQLMAADVDDIGLAAAVEQRNYLPLRVDYRNIVAEIMMKHMGLPENVLGTIFPGFTAQNLNLFQRNVA